MAYGFSLSYSAIYIPKTWHFFILIHYVQSTHVSEFRFFDYICASMFTIQDFKQCIQDKKCIKKCKSSVNALRYVKVMGYVLQMCK